jgi:hypothetical protein
VDELVRRELDDRLQMVLQLIQLEFIPSSIHLCEPGTTDLSFLLLRHDNVVELRDVRRKVAVIVKVHTVRSRQCLGDRPVLALPTFGSQSE